MPDSLRRAAIFVFISGSISSTLLACAAEDPTGPALEQDQSPTDAGSQPDLVPLQDTAQDDARAQDTSPPEEEPDAAPIVPTQFSFSSSCTPVEDGLVDLSFEIHPTTTSYQITPYANNGSSIGPLLITTPSGLEIDFSQDNAFQVNLFAPNGFNPTIVPAAPQFHEHLESGSHLFSLTSTADEVCFYLYETVTEHASVVDLNFYFVGLDDKDLDAISAPAHAPFQSMLTTIDEVLEQAELSIGERRYFDVSQDITDAHRIITSKNQVSTLVSHSQTPGDDLDDRMSINIFLVEKITYGPLGVSMGLPGVVGVHGSWLSGVVVSAEYLGLSPPGTYATALATAHEVGHFLGLPHTSEVDGQTFDPLNDTARCDEIDSIDPADCPDWGNLMFPLSDLGNETVTPDQAFMLRVNPLAK